MQFTTAGIILYTDRYDDCVRFYGSTLELPIMFQIDRPGETLTCFDLGGAYLMVEVGGPASASRKTIERSPIKFRFNVADIEATCAKLSSKGLRVAVQHHAWGSTAEFFDPDGNRCALRTNEGFGV